MTPAIRASQIPVPARDGRCSRCACSWNEVPGLPNLRDVLCDLTRCACHSSMYAVALYEGSSLDIDQLISSGAQE